MIVLPAEAMGWTGERRRLALLHELAHIGRWDGLTQGLARGVRALYWFHPLVWVAAARAQAECERACDDRVLTTGTKSSAYANTLMEYAVPLARGGTSAGCRCHAPAGALAMARPSTLEGRLLAILDGGRNRRGLTWRLGVGVLAVVVGLSAGLGMLRAQTSETRPATGTAGPGGTRRLELRPDTVMPGTWGGTSRMATVPGAATTRAGAAGTEPGQTTIEYVQLKNAKAVDVAKLVNDLYAPNEFNRKLIYADSDARTNTVVLNGRADLVKQATEIIQKIETIATPAATTTRGGAPGPTATQTTTERVPLRTSRARDVAGLINAMFSPSGAAGNGQRLRAEADDRTNTITLTGPADQVKAATDIIEKTEHIPDLQDTTVFFIVHLKAANPTAVAESVNARFGPKMAGAAAGPATSGRSNTLTPGKQEAYCVPNLDTNSVLLTCDRSNEQALRAHIKALDEAAAADTKPAGAMP